MTNTCCLEANSSKATAEDLFVALDASMQQAHGNLYQRIARAHNPVRWRSGSNAAQIEIKKASHSGQIRA